MIRRLITAVAVTASACTVLAGCGSDDKPADSPAVAWSEAVCKSIDAGSAKLTQIPSIDPTNPAAAKDSLLGYLGSVSGALDTLSKDIKAAGAPPVKDGQTTLDKAMATLTTTKAALDGARTKLQAAVITDPASYQVAMGELSTIMGSVANIEGPAKDFKDQPELKEAFGKAPTCLKINGGQSPS
jgi:hypothetical protein